MTLKNSDRFHYEIEVAKGDRFYFLALRPDQLSGTKVFLFPWELIFGQNGFDPEYFINSTLLPQFLFILRRENRSLYGD